METNLFISDTHINGSVSLINPQAVLDDGGGYKLSRTQSWLWECWLKALDIVKAEKAGELYTHFLGDMVDLDVKSRSAQIITRNPATAIEWGHDQLAPLAEMSTGVSWLRGTEAHVGTSAYSEENLAKMFDNTMREPSTGKASWWWMLWRSDNITFDLAHHPSTGAGGTNPQTRFNGINRLASYTESDYVDRLHAMPPNFVIRGHIHQFRDSRDHYATRAITLPPWTMLNAYNLRHGITFPENVGKVMIFCDKGKSHVRPILFSPDPPKYFSSAVWKGTKNANNN